MRSTRTSPPSESISATCGCLAATRRLARDDETADGSFGDNIFHTSSVSASASSPFVFSSPAPIIPSQFIPGQQPSSSPSAALLQGRAITTHWARLSTTCPNSHLHLSSPSILRYMVTALRSISRVYEAHLWQMVFAATKPPQAQGRSYQIQNGGVGPQTTEAGQGQGQEQGHIGIYRLEQDETQILLQEALRTSIEELGGLLSEIQRRVAMIRANPTYAAGNVNLDYLLLNMGTNQENLNGFGAASYHTGSLGTEMDIEMDLNLDGDESNLGDDERLQNIQVPPLTDEEMSEINMRLYQCLRRLDFLESGEGIKDTDDGNRW